MSRIVCIGCGKAKLPRLARARELYTGVLFRKHLRYARRFASPVFVLSAKYGLVAETQILAPYNESLNSKPRAELEAWARSVAAKVMQITRPGDEVVILAGKRYCKLAEYLSDRKVFIPFQGLKLGERLAALKATEKKPCM